MAGETRIIAFGANGGESTGSGAASESEAALIEAASPNSESDSLGEPADEVETAPDRKTRAALVGTGLIVLAWTGFFIWSQAALPPPAPAAIPALAAQWAIPVLLVATVWLILMRSSSREASRFGDVATLLSREAASLEERLRSVNGELSLAREFVAAQSRDLESLGRVAVERLSQNADRLQGLIHENGGRLDAIGEVSASALENMDRLRGQLPVIASSAKDVTNQLGNAGMAARAQLEELINGFNRLNEFGIACGTQVEHVRNAVNEATAEFARASEQLESHTATRFATLAEQGAEFRNRLDADEADALAAVRTRAKALADEIAATREALDGHEAESLTSLRARLTALRDESDVVGRALREREGRAVEAWQSRLAALEEERGAVDTRIDEAERTAFEVLRERVARLEGHAADIHANLASKEADALASLHQRVEHLGVQAGDLQGRISATEQHAIATVSEQLAALDGVLAQRLGEHEYHSEALASRAAALAATLDDYGRRMAEVAQSGAEYEASLARSLNALVERLHASRNTLVSVDDDVARLTDASVRLLELIRASAEQTAVPLSQALAAAEDRLARLAEGLARLVAGLEDGVTRGGDVQGIITSAQDSLATLFAQYESGQAQVSARSESHAAQFAALRTALEDIRTASEQTEAHTRDELGAAVERLGEAVREALGALEREGPAQVDAIASHLGEASAEAVEKVMRTRVAETAGAIEQAVAHASGAGREAATQLREQLAAVSDLVAHLEGRVLQARQGAQEQVGNDFSRRFASITDALNSASIDIASALSIEVTDTAWAAYLKGDRGIFTRRAVSLLGSGEAKAIQQLFERDETFHANVSRYIHDFEALLRQVLSTREGNALGVTLLSSDMGKLYVALAQGIERLRS